MRVCVTARLLARGQGVERENKRVEFLDFLLVNPGTDKFISWDYNSLNVIYGN
jgi:hypothetical protein